MLLGKGKDHDGSNLIPMRLPEAAMNSTPGAHLRVVPLSRMNEDSLADIQCDPQLARQIAPIVHCPSPMQAP